MLLEGVPSVDEIKDEMKDEIKDEIGLKAKVKVVDVEARSEAKLELLLSSPRARFQMDL